MQCARHPAVETELACGRCGVAICPQCLVHTPVGARCPACAQIRRIPTYQVPPLYYLRGAAAAAVVGLLGGAAWWFLFPFNFGFFFALLLGAAFGYAVAGAVGWATNHKRGPVLQALAGGGVVIAYIARNLLEGEAVVPSGDIFGYLLVVVAIAVAASQLR
ncbi:MAG: hypothetical protein ACE5IZ_00855 [Dehalococcoidia bacterium]